MHTLPCLFICLSVSAAAYADCGCDYTVPTGQHVIDGKAIGVKPGDVICLKGGTNYQNLKFININGSADKLVTIQNCGGKVTINTSATFAMKVNRSKYFRVSGSGDGGHQYGIELRGGKSLGISLGELSTEFEIDHLEVHDIGFAGIMAKTDPSCGKPYDRSKFTMKNIKIHDNYVYDTKGEGLYVGNSMYAKGMNTSCGRQLPHEIHNAKIYNNVVKRTGWDGIQVGSATKGCEVYNNTVEDYGQRQNSVHGNGIQLGEGTGGKCYNNTIKNGYSAGIIVLGWGDNVVFNNVLVNPGRFGTFIDSRPPASPGDGFKFLNNTIIRPQENGVRIYADESSLRNQVKNNIIVGGSQPVKLLHSGITNTDVSNNYETSDINKVSFVNAGAGDYHLKGSSPCIDKGENLYSKGVTFAKDKKSRPKSGAFEQGVYTYGGTSAPPANQAPRVSVQSDLSVALPTTTATLEAKASDPDGSIASYEWAMKSGASAIKLKDADKPKVYISELQEGNYLLTITVKDDKGASASGEVKITVKATPPKENPPPPPPPPGESGLNFTYHEGEWNKLPDFRNTPTKKYGRVINFDIGPRNRDENFGFQFYGYIDIAKAGTYTFYTMSDDGSKLYIDGREVVDNDGLHPPKEKSGATYLTAGQHAIHVTFFEKTGYEILNVSYAGPGISKQRIPSEILSTQRNKKASASVASQSPGASTVKAYAGSDRTVSTTSSVLLHGKGVGPNSFRKYEWKKVSGPNASMSGQKTANLDISRLQAGTYRFRFTATDSQGNKASDEMNLTATDHSARTVNGLKEKELPGASGEFGYQVHAYPNEVLDRLQVDVTGAKDETLTLQLVDVVGRIMLEQPTKIEQDRQEVVLNVKQYVTTPGLFYLVVSQPSGDKTTHRLIKK